MPSHLVDYERLPFPPGEAPFHVKGTAYKGHVEYTNEHVPGGMAAAVAAIEDPALRAFFDQSFLASSLYDVYPLIVMGHVCARLTSRTFPDFLRVRTRHQVESDLGGVYKLLLKIASPEAVARKIPQATGQYFDFAPAEVDAPAPNVVVARWRTMPTTILPWYAPIIETYVVRALELNGASGAKAKRYRFTETGESYGVEVGTLRIDYSWD